MFRPMAQVVLLALAGALVLPFTFVPAMVALFLRRHGRGEGEPSGGDPAPRAYRPVLRLRACATGLRSSAGPR